MRKRITRIDEKKGIYMRDPKLEISNASETSAGWPIKASLLSVPLHFIPPRVCTRTHVCRSCTWTRALQVTLLTGPILHRASMCGINCTFVERFKTLRMDVSWVVAARATRNASRFWLPFLVPADRNKYKKIITTRSFNHGSKVYVSWRLSRHNIIIES